MPASWLNVTHYKQQGRADCLAACAAMVLDYQGLPVNYSRLLRLFDITPDLGAPASRIRRLAHLGVKVSYGSGDLEDLRNYLAQGMPVIVFVRTIHLSYWDADSRHAVVVVGMDETQVYLNDPFHDTVPQFVARLEFALAWDEMDNTYTVIEEVK